MAKSGNDEPVEPERIDNTLDTVLITALRENFEIKSGCHVDRNEILEFLRSVINGHPELNFVLQHRDTKLSSRIYKAFPKVTTKRVAVPNIRGKKTWTYTNLRKISNRVASHTAKQNVTQKKAQATRLNKTETKGKSDLPESSLMPSSKREKKPYRSRRTHGQSASMVQRDSLFETYKRDREFSQRSSRAVGSVPQQSYLGRFNDMLRWMKEHYILENTSSIPVKRIVEDIKAEFKINITYKQSHKLIFAVFPGTASRADHPVKIEADGDCYSYRGITPKPKPGQDEKQCGVSESNASPLQTNNEQQNARKCVDTRQAWVPPDNSSENGRKRIFRTRKRFIQACAVLKPAEEAISRARYDVTPTSSEILPMGSEMTPRFSNVSPRFPNFSPKVSDVSPRFSDASSKISETSPRCSEISSNYSEMSPRIAEVSAGLYNFSPRHSDVSPRFYDVPPVVSEEWRRCDNDWQRLYEELKQERDQAILERNQAMVSLMEIEREQVSRTPDDVSRRPTTVTDVEPSTRWVFPKSERRESQDWLGSLMSRSSSVLGEQGMSEANAVYFPGSTLQSNSRNQRYPELEKYELLKQERDAMWKNWIDKLTAEKDDVIQQLKLEKMEVIQRMELEKSDAVESIEEKLTNQITILTREMRELKELLNHTMNERTLAIEHAHKLTELLSEDSLKVAGLESFPFDVTKDQVVRPTKLKTPDEISTQKAFVCFGKGSKRKQSMPAKLKKIPRLESSVSNELEKYADIPRNPSQTVSTDSEKLLTVSESTDSGSINVNCDGVTVDNGLGNDRFVDNGVIDTVDDVAADTIDDVATDTIDNVAIEYRATDQSKKVSISPVIDSENVLSETHTACTKLLRNYLAASAVQHVQSGSVPGDNHATDNAPASVFESQAESSVMENSNVDVFNKSDNAFLASDSRNVSDRANIVKTEFTNSGSWHKVSSDACSSSEKVLSEIPRASIIPENSSCIRNLDTCPKSLSTKNSENPNTTALSKPGNSDSENFSVNNQPIIRILTDINNHDEKVDCVDPSNALKHFSETSGKYSPSLSNSGKYTCENSNFQKYVGEFDAPNLPLNTELQILNPEIPGSIPTRSDSKFLAKDGAKSFEESVNSTFRKFFPEVPQSSFNSPLTTESSKYFRDIPRAVSSSVSPVSRKFIQDPGNQALVYPNKNGVPQQNKLSSIDFLNSMVENIGKSSVE